VGDVKVARISILGLASRELSPCPRCNGLVLANYDEFYCLLCGTLDYIESELLIRVNTAHPDVQFKTPTQLNLSEAMKASWECRRQGR